MSDQSPEQEPVLESGMGGADTGGSPGSVSGAGISGAEARDLMERLGTEAAPDEEPVDPS